MTLTNVKTLADRGVEILAGTDGGNFGVFQGYSVHREMALFVEAGLTPWAALRAASTRASRFLGKPWGVAAGDAASVVVLDASPLDDIRNTEKIHFVIFEGEIMDREVLIARK